MKTEAPSTPAFTGVNHLALIAHDLDATIRFYRDLLGMRLVAATGSSGAKHYCFEITKADRIAFFGWDGAAKVTPKRPGVPTSAPRGFDHVAIGVRTKADLFAFRDRLRAAGVLVEGPVDHGISWSIYFKDPNDLDLELAWDALEVLEPIAFDADPPPAAMEGPEPRRDAFPAVADATPEAAFTAKAGVGHELAELLVGAGLARASEPR